VLERDDGRPLEVRHVPGGRGWIERDRGGVVADGDLRRCMAASGCVLAVAGVSVDHGDAGVFLVGDVDLVGPLVDGDADGAEAGGALAGVWSQPLVFWPLQVAPLITEIVPGFSPSAMLAV
jgi:hypothetical protein